MSSKSIQHASPPLVSESCIAIVLLRGASSQDSGDSYSSVKLGANELPRPSETNRLGSPTPFPGITWNEEDKPNWVGHFLSKPGVNPSLFVYDYAVGGHTVDDMRSQVLKAFKATCDEGVPWTADDSLFVSWIGINDIGTFKDTERQLKTLFELQEHLYTTAGARNFLFIDVPPINRCPVQFTPSPTRYQTWNTTLHSLLSTFTTSHPRTTTTLLFSSHDLFTRILDDPSRYHFDETTAHVAGGCFWYDYLHPTSKVHDAIASEVVRFLQLGELSDSESTFGLSGSAAGIDSEGASTGPEKSVV